MKLSGKIKLKPDVMPKDILRGSGLTKEVLERNERAMHRIEELDGKRKAESDKATAELQAGIEQAMAATRENMVRGAHITLDESQERALEGILHNTCAVLIGAAGTGKTTLLRRVLKAWIAKEAKARYESGAAVSEAVAEKTVLSEINVSAFTGAAAKQARNAIPRELASNVSTVHLMLGYQPADETTVKEGIISGPVELRKRKFESTYTADNKLNTRFLIIDEASMLPVPLWNKVKDALHDGVKILFVGDIQQLPPVGSQSVLGYAMAKWPTFELTEPHRNAGPIVQNAHKILHGRFPEACKHFYIIGTRNGTKNSKGEAIKTPRSQEKMQTYFIRQMQAMRAQGLYDPMRDFVIVPKRTPNSMLSTVNLNNYFVPLMNPPRKAPGRAAMVLNPRNPIFTGKRIARLAVGDKIMITANINSVISTRGVPINNGQMGVIEAIDPNPDYNVKKGGALFGADSPFGGNVQEPEDNEDQDNEDWLNDLQGLTEERLDANPDDDGTEDDPEGQRASSHITRIRFEDGSDYSLKNASDYSKIDFGYAMTCHKSQGNEAPNVFVLMHSSDRAGNLMTREWLYTAITRAQENVFLYTDDVALSSALSTQKITGSTLAEKIQSFRNFAEHAEYGTVELPDLPESILKD